MTRAAKCLADSVAAGKITQAAADNAAARVNTLLEKGVSEAEAMTRAAAEISKAAADKQNTTALRILAADRTLTQAQGHPSGMGFGVAALFARDVTGRAGYSSIEGRARAVAAEAHARLVHLLDAYRTKNLGFSQDLPGLRRFVRALYGDAGDPAAGAFAKAWGETTDILAARFNAAGGNLPRRETWRLPQSFDHAEVKRAGQGAFTRFMNEALDKGDLRLVDFDTGEALPAEGMARIIDDAWQRIASNGVSDMVPGQPGGVALANSRAQPRVFEWTSADAYLRFNDKFGVTDAGLYDLLVGHVDGMAKDIAMMEILGPNPTLQARVLIDTAEKGGTSKASLHMLGNIWNQVTGASSVPASEFAANLMRGVRSWLTSVQLGSAMLSSVTDFATIRETAAWNGLPATQVMQRYLSLLDPRNAEDRRTAVQLGLIADGWTQRALGAQRHQAEIVGRDLPGRIADTVLRVSGMSAHTQAAKWAFGMEFSAHLAERAGKTLAELEPEMQRSFARYGITAEDWDIIRTHGVWEDEGARFILPELIANGPPQPRADAPGAPIDEAAAAGGRQRAEDVAPPGLHELEPAIGSPVRVGDRPRADKTEALRRLSSSMDGWTLERLYVNGEANQAALNAALRDAAGGIEGATARDAPLKKQDKAAEKIIRKNYADASKLTDVVRGGFDVATPADSEALLRALARRYPVLDEGWTLTPFGYFDRKALLRLDDGTIAEVQFWPPGMFEAKGDSGGGHKMYEEARDTATSPERVAELERQMRDLYSETMAAAGNDWSDMAMPGGGQRSAGTQARISASEMTAPLSPTSAQDTGTQGPSSRRMANALPSDGMTAGRPSQSTNSIAASPSAPIIPQVDPAFSRAASRYLEMVQTETGYAVVEPGAVERAMMLGSSRPGTLGGEFRRSVAQYKSFPVAMLTRHVSRGIDAIRGGDHGVYLATLGVSLTVMGAFAMQLKSIAQGKDPRDMTDPKFWGAAFMQGGGAGLFGDFLYAGVSRSNAGFYMAVAGGPTAGLIDDIARLTGGNLQGLAEDKDTNFGAEMARFVQRNTPGTSLWYSRLAMDRLMWNRLQELMDPQAANRWRRLEQRALDDYDQRFFWAPGDAAPERGPSLPAAIGAAR